MLIPPLRELYAWAWDVYSRRAGCHHLAVTPFFSERHPPDLPFLCPKKEAKKVSLFRGSEPRLRGYSPLRTPKRRSSAKKAKTCRSAARFLTLFRSSPIDPSGAKCLYPRSVGADARHRPALGRRQFAVVEKRPPCVKGAPAKRVGDCDLAHKSTYPRTRSNPSVTAYAVPPPFTQGRLCTREALRGDASIAPYTRTERLPSRGSTGRPRRPVRPYVTARILRVAAGY